LLNSPSNAVKYEAAAALMTLTSAPTAVKGKLLFQSFFFLSLNS